MALAGTPMQAVALPILTVMMGLIASIVAVGMMKLLERTDPAGALRNVTFIGAGIFLVAMWFVVQAVGVEIVDVEEVPLAYLPGNATRIMVKAVGDLEG